MEENKEQVLVSDRKVIRVSKQGLFIGIIVIVLSLIFVSLSSISNLYRLFFYILPLLIISAVIYLIWGIVQHLIGKDDEIRKKAKHKVKWGIIYIVFIILIWGIIRVVSDTFQVGPEQLNDRAIPCIPNPSLGIDCGNSYGNYNNNGQASISDTREFLKTNYGSTIKTRNVSKVVRYVENAIKGADGRVDSISVNEKYGHVRFVVAKSEFEDFRRGVEELTHKKLYTESVSSENLLTEKQGIEEQQGNIVNSLDNWMTQRDNLITKHNQTVSSINKKITKIGKELAAVRAKMSIETDINILTSLVNQEAYLIEQDKSQKKSLTSENSSYAIQKKNLDDLINNENSNLTNINKVDSQFMDNVETVNGYINVDWVSLWEMARIFSPIPPSFVILILIILGWLLLRKRKFVPKVVFE